MIELTALLGFAVAVTPLVLTPGASFTLVSARGMVGDRSGAWACIAGTAVGIITHAVLAGVGLAAVVMQSAELYRLLRLAGAAYLIGLGLWLWLRSRSSTEQGSSDAMRRHSAWIEGRRALVANVLNVKAAAVYLTLAPQFLSASQAGVAAMVQLGAVHILVMVLWLGLWATGLTALSARFDRLAWSRRINQLGGAVLVFLGIRSAAQVR
ncbi:MAG: LysE family translocator [Arachnia propionica]|uniref:LysE family translocator n=1 Tax=Arachnia propionica TaxID=1750 RepID=UPI0027099D1C|nr:LysE family translocator [Arachnia propionica]